MHDGRVTVVAKDATVRQILTEWARVGQTKIVNVERIPGGPISIELTDVPEAQALDVLLRSVSGIHGGAPADASGQSVSLRSDSGHADAGVDAHRQRARRCRRSSSRTTQTTTNHRPITPVPGRGPIFTFPPVPRPQGVNPVQGGIPTVVPGIGGAIPAPVNRRQRRYRRCSRARQRPPGRQPPRLAVHPSPGMIAPVPAPTGQPSLSSHVPFIDDINAAIADAMRKQEPIRSARAAHAQGGADEPRDRARPRAGCGVNRSRW